MSPSNSNTIESEAKIRFPLVPHKKEQIISNVSPQTINSDSEYETPKASIRPEPTLSTPITSKPSRGRGRGLGTPNIPNALW